MLRKIADFFTISHSITLLLFVGFFIWGNVLLNGFIADDDLLVSQNLLIRSVQNIPSFFFGSSFYTGGSQLAGHYYRPLMPATFSLIYVISGDHAFVFHFFQIAFHITNAILLFFVFKYFFKTFPSLLLSLVFLVHPMNVEAVAYISDTQDVLFVTLGLITLLVLIFKHSTNHELRTKNKKVSWKLISIISLLLLTCLFFKEVGVLFILMGGVFLYLYKRELLKFYSIASVVILAIYIPFRTIAVGIGSVQDKTFPIMKLSFFERLLTIPKVIFYYISTFFFPKDLSFWQHWVVKEATFSDFFLPLLFIVIFFGGLIFIGIKLKKEKIFPVYVFFSIWFVIGLLAHSQFIPLDGTVSDRWFYFPIIGLLGIAGVTAGTLKITSERLKIALLVCLAIVISLLSVRTIIRNSNWQNGLTLYSHDSNVNTNSFSLENSLGFELAQVGQYDEAITHLKKSTQLMPDWPIHWSNLAAAYGKRGIEKNNIEDLDMAKYYFRQSIKHGTFFQAYQNLAKIMMYKGEYKEAKEFLEQSLQKMPDNVTLWILLSQTNEKLGDKKSAIVAAEQAYRLSQSPEVYQWIEYLSQGK